MISDVYDIIFYRKKKNTSLPKEAHDPLEAAPVRDQFLPMNHPGERNKQKKCIYGCPKLL